jgi:hypothetical protein
MGPAILHWVVQRSALTRALITFVSFSDCADAERHKAELEAIVDPLGRTNVLAIESLPVNQFPETKPELALARVNRASRLDTSDRSSRKVAEMISHSRKSGAD